MHYEYRKNFYEKNISEKDTLRKTGRFFGYRCWHPGIGIISYRKGFTAAIDFLYLKMMGIKGEPGKQWHHGIFHGRYRFSDASFCQ
jgi:hypothetical protein